MTNMYETEEVAIYLRDLEWDLDKIYEALSPHGYSQSQIFDGWMRFYNADQRGEYVYYSQQDAEEALNEMLDEYIENSLGSIFTQDAITIQTARETGLEAVNLTGEGWAFPKFIEGGDGSGCRVVWGEE